MVISNLDDFSGYHTSSVGLAYTLATYLSLPINKF